MLVRLMILALALAPLTATANPDWYVGVASGHTNYRQLDEFGSAVYDRMVEEFRIEPTQTHFIENTQPFSLIGTVGADFSPHLGAELAYTMLGRADWYLLGDARVPSDAFKRDVYANLYHQRTRLNSDGVALSILGHWPLGSLWRLNGRAGAFYTRTRANAEMCHQTGAEWTDALGNYHSTVKEFCSPTMKTDPSTGEQIGTFADGTLGNKTLSTRSTMPMLAAGIERVGRTGGSWRLEYSMYRMRNPPVQGAASTSVVQFLTIGFTLRSGFFAGLQR